VASPGRCGPRPTRACRCILSGTRWPTAILRHSRWPPRRRSLRNAATRQPASTVRWDLSTHPSICPHRKRLQASETRRGRRTTRNNVTSRRASRRHDGRPRAPALNIAASVGPPSHSSPSPRRRVRRTRWWRAGSRPRSSHRRGNRDSRGSCDNPSTATGHLLRLPSLRISRLRAAGLWVPRLRTARLQIPRLGIPGLPALSWLRLSRLLGIPRPARFTNLWVSRRRGIPSLPRRLGQPSLWIAT
jgi:hypothetical protein